MDFLKNFEDAVVQIQHGKTDARIRVVSNDLKEIGQTRNRFANNNAALFTAKEYQARYLKALVTDEQYDSTQRKKMK